MIARIVERGAGDREPEPSSSSSRAARPTGRGDEIRRQIELHPERRDRLRRARPAAGRRRRAARLRGGRADDVLMILDADLTVRPTDLPTFYDALVAGRRGARQRVAARLRPRARLDALPQRARQQALLARLQRPARPAREGHALRHEGAAPRATTRRSPPAAATSATSTPSATSTCCSARPAQPEDRRPARPLRRPTYGESNISRFRHGWLMLRMAVFAFRKLKIDPIRV